MNIEQLDLTVREIVKDYEDAGEGGKTTEDNCQMLCKKCNREKSTR